MTANSGLSPIVNTQTAVLILGSYPGAISLATGEYYAHPRNQFWRIMEHLFDVKPTLNYKRRLQALLEKRIGLWDVVGACARPGSMDASIQTESIVPNRIAMLIEQLPHLRAIFLNGQTAAKLFARYNQFPPSLSDRLKVAYLPSTSPAHAAMAFGRKVELWSTIRDQAYERT